MSSSLSSSSHATAVSASVATATSCNASAPSSAPPNFSGPSCAVPAYLCDANFDVILSTCCETANNHPAPEGTGGWYVPRNQTDDVPTANYNDGKCDWAYCPIVNSDSKDVFEKCFKQEKFDTVYACFDGSSSSTTTTTGGKTDDKAENQSSGGSAASSTGSSTSSTSSGSSSTASTAASGAAKSSGSVQGGAGNNSTSPSSTRKTSSSTTSSSTATSTDAQKNTGSGAEKVFGGVSKGVMATAVMLIVGMNFGFMG